MTDDTTSIGSSSSESHVHHQIDEFFLKHLDSIIDMYEYLKESLCYNPLFLAKMQSTHITEFLIDCIFDDSMSDCFNTIDKKKYDKFAKQFEAELNFSYKTIQNFVTKSGYKTKINPVKWGMLSFMHSYM